MEEERYKWILAAYLAPRSKKVQNGCYPSIVGLCNSFWFLHERKRRKKKKYYKGKEIKGKLDKKKEYYKGEEAKDEK